MSNGNNNTNIFILLLLTLTAIIGVSIALVNIYGVKDKDSCPVKEMVNVDSIAINNDSIKLIVNNIDSIKNAEVIEVLNLDNDSTIRLFYRLCKE